MNDCELISYITAIACTIIKCIPDDDDIALMAAGFTQLGDTLATYLTQKSIKDNKKTLNSDNNNIFDKDTV
ncbi:hypothetical protein EDD66_102242 [Mobilisporobacter senegalensis]|uniref:DUF6774 domain-containing protein n=1 Tax=Mobilisporobacter senegalensis TaxID=1329262 RepID=A0A3N1XVF2_9FIRM|nr:DUF6774 domain-containing protein [Mobilisporobacter senegalensis]ROR30589.1 hypothetical protein EDD66_102242 [Mobilisporobacter senegalensis]